MECISSFRPSKKIQVLQNWGWGIAAYMSLGKCIYFSFQNFNKLTVHTRIRKMDQLQNSNRKSHKKVHNHAIFTHCNLLKNNQRDTAAWPFEEV